MSKHLPNKVFQFLLIIYVLVQSTSLVIHKLWLYLSYELIFILLIPWAMITSVKQFKKTASFRETKAQIISLLLAGILLTVFYVITIILDPSIELKFDPDFNDFQSLLIFFPLTQSIFASLLIALASGLTKLWKLK